MPNVVLEAMAAGLAIVTTRNGASELLRGNGRVVDHPEPLALRAAIEPYLRDRSLLISHQARSRRLAEGMSWSTVADYLMTVFEQVVRAPDEVAAAPAREFRLPAV